MTRKKVLIYEKMMKRSRMVRRRQVKSEEEVLVSTSSLPPSEVSRVEEAGSSDIALR